LQLVQEVDLILEGTGVFTQAVDDWTAKWSPAIPEYGYILAGKKATIVLTAQKTYEGVHAPFTCTYLNNSCSHHFCACICGYSAHA